MKKILLVLSAFLLTETHAEVVEIPNEMRDYFMYVHDLTAEMSVGAKSFAEMIENGKIDFSRSQTQKLACEVINSTDRLDEINRNKPKDSEEGESRTVKAMMGISTKLMIELDKVGAYCPK